MTFVTVKLASRITSKLKNTRWDLGEETRLNQCRKAVAEAFNFDGEGDMQRSLPCESEWNGEWCANHLADNMFVNDPLAARCAVEKVEAIFSNVLFDPDEHAHAPQHSA